MPLSSTPSVFAVPSRHRRAETIANDLRSMILNNTLAIGQKLPTESALCQQYNVSRTTLREAIQMLRSAGMLDVTPGRGSFVRAPQLASLIPALQLIGRGRHFATEDVHALLQNLVTHALHATPALAARLREASQQLYPHTLIRNADAPSCAEQEANWYMAILQATEQSLHIFLGQVLLPMMAESRRNYYQFGGPDSTMKTIQLQLRVNAALLEGDTATALRLLAPQPKGPSIPQAA